MIAATKVSLGFGVLSWKSFLNMSPMMLGGYTFIISTGVVLVTLVALEKMGFAINNELVELFVKAGALALLVWFIFNNPILWYLR